MLKKRFLVSLLFVFTVFLSLQVSDVLAADPITFEDKQLEKAIRDAINKPSGDIFEEDVNQLNVFDATHQKITNLNGIEKLESLTELRLAENEISDITL